MAGATLDAKGWHLTEEGIEQCRGDNNKKDEKIVEIAKDTDLKEIGKKWLPDDVNKGSCEYVEGPGVLQIQKIRNIAAPKDNETSQGAPRLLKLTFTDGHLNCNGVETEKLDKFGLDIPPGSKILLKGTVAVEHGFLLLTNKNCQLIGGRVLKMAESWELKKMLSKQSKLRGVTEGGPPPFVPFGHRIQDAKVVNQKDNFKSLTAKKEEKKEEGEFEQQRKATIAEALQAKEEKSKTFGGGQKQVGSDKDIARLMEMGFSAEQASSALRQNNGNFQLSVDYLIQGRGGSRQSQYGGDRDRQAPSGGRDYQGRQPREDRRENRGRRQKDEDTEEMSSRPSAPATLFDFLSMSKKIPVENGKENKENKDSKSFNSVPSKSMQYSNDGSKQSDRGYKPKYADASSKYGRDEPGNDRRNFDNRPKSSPAYSSQKSNYENKTQRPDSSYDRNKQQQNYNDSGRGNQSQHNNNDRNYGNERSQNQADRYSNNRRPNYNNEKPTRNEQNQGYEKRTEQDRRSNYNDRNSQNDRRSNQNNYDRQPSYEKRLDSDKRPNYSDSQKDSRRSNQNSSESRDFQKKNQGERTSSGRIEMKDNYNRNNRQDPQKEQSKDSYKGKSQNSETVYQRQSNENNSRKKDYPATDSQKKDYPPADSQNKDYPPTDSQKKDYPATNSQQFQNQGQPRVWNTGEHCLAKYWEDNQYYHAVIHHLSNHTAVVLFLEYGNHEEVELTDIKPLHEVPLPDFSVPPPGMFTYSVPPPSNQQTTNQIQTMEFRRRKMDVDKPTMQYYQPPKQRYN